MRALMRVTVVPSAAVALAASAGSKTDDGAKGSGSAIAAAHTVAVASPQIDAANPSQGNTVSFGQLLEDYRADRAAADAKYLDKRLRVDAEAIRERGSVLSLMTLDNYDFVAKFRAGTKLGLPYAPTALTVSVTIDCLAGQAKGLPTLTDCILLAPSSARIDRLKAVNALASLLVNAKFPFTVELADDSDDTLDVMRACNAKILDEMAKDELGESMRRSGFKHVRCDGGEPARDL